MGGFDGSECAGVAGETRLVCPTDPAILSAVKTVTVSEAEGRLGQLLAEAARGDVIVLTDGEIRVTLTPGDPRQPLDPEQDSPELEAELLNAIDGPYLPYFEDEFRAIGESIVGESRRP